MPLLFSYSHFFYQTISRKLICFCCVCFFTLTACTNAPPSQTELSNTGKPALHAIQSKRLKKLMQELNDLMFERMLNEVQIDQQRRRYTQEVVKISDQLLNSLKYMPEIFSSLTLTKTEQKVFLSLNHQLEQQVTLLKQEAVKNLVDALPKRRRQIIETCNACHQMFRPEKKQ